jgi:8-oxo-dGTP pyrophosphatase MutT (NUDIX family)
VPCNGRLLLVEERARGELVLNQPAGHLEAGESLIEAAARETLEESGWEVAITHLVGVYRWCAEGDVRHHQAASGETTPVAGPTFLRFAFAAEPVRHHPERPLDRGIERTLWLTPAELRAAGNRR